MTVWINFPLIVWCHLALFSFLLPLQFLFIFFLLRRRLGAKPAVPALSVLLTPTIEVLTWAGNHKEPKPILYLKRDSFRRMFPYIPSPLSFSTKLFPQTFRLVFFFCFITLKLTYLFLHCCFTGRWINYWLPQYWLPLTWLNKTKSKSLLFLLPPTVKWYSLPLPHPLSREIPRSATLPS